MDHVRAINLSNNLLGSAGLKTVARSLAGAKQLTALDLCMNPAITATRGVGKTLGTAAARCASLRHLGVTLHDKVATHNPFHHRGKQHALCTLVLLVTKTGVSAAAAGGGTRTRTKGARSRAAGGRRGVADTRKTRRLKSSASSAKGGSKSSHHAVESVDLVHALAVSTHMRGCGAIVSMLILAHCCSREALVANRVAPPPPPAPPDLHALARLHRRHHHHLQVSQACRLPPVPSIATQCAA